MNQHLYATPRIITALQDCFFDHTLDLPEYRQIKCSYNFKASRAEIPSP